MDAIQSDGGMCAPIPPSYDMQPALEEAGVNRAAAAIRTLIPGPYASGARDIAIAAIRAYTRPNPIESMLPRIGAPRGAINFLPVPPDGGWPTPAPVRPVRQRWNVAVVAVRRERQRVASGVRRIRDARAVLTGRKDAYTEAEIDGIAMAEY